MATALHELIAGDEPDAWTRLGFAVEDGEIVRVGGVRVRLDGEGGGLREWVLRGDGGPEVVGGIPTRWTSEASDAEPAPLHPNGTLALDHVVLFCDSRDAVVAELVDAGGDLRRRAEPPTVPVAMAFVRFGEAIVEVAEPGGAPRLWGLVAVVEDLDELARELGDEVLGEPRDAVQPGRRIVTVRRELGLGVALAFMTPRVR